MPDNGVDAEVELRLPEPFERFFRREYPRMVAVAYAISGSRWAAEEIAQEACLRAYRQWDRISGYDKPGAWLRRVTINLSNSLLRRKVSELKALQRSAFGGVGIIDPHPEDEIEFWDQVRALPKRQREVMVLHFVDDMSSGEIADVLGISESSVRSHLQRGRTALTQRVDIEDWA